MYQFKVWYQNGADSEDDFKPAALKRYWAMEAWFIERFWRQQAFRCVRFVLFELNYWEVR